MNKLNKKLNLTPNKKEVGRNSVVSRRESVVKGINNQLLICESLINDGEVYRDFNGRKVISWFWLNEEGKYFLSINYGKKAIELSKGKFSVICENLEEVIDSLNIIKDSVLNGDLDKELEKRSKLIRSNFKK
tara:strand:- start:735 stop:1130 length:396 start_codon:yes stop_codon:yes gene_type:complete